MSKLFALFCLAVFAAVPAFGQGVVVWWGCNDLDATPCPAETHTYFAGGTGQNCSCGGGCNVYLADGAQWLISADAGYHIAEGGSCPSGANIYTSGGLTQSPGAPGPNGVRAYANAWTQYGSTWYEMQDYCNLGSDPVFYGYPNTPLPC